MAFPVLAPSIASVVQGHRAAVRGVVDRVDDRLLVVVGPQAVHDAAPLLDYAEQLPEAAAPYTGQLLVVLGAQLDTDNAGRAHGFALDALSAGLPLAVRLTAPASTPQLAAYALTDPRTAAEHRLALPMGCESGAGGDIGEAVGALRQAADQRHAPPEPARHVHLVLRTPPHRADHDLVRTDAALARLRAAGLPQHLVVAITGGGDPQRRRRVAASVARRLGEGHQGIVGVVIPSFLHEGHQRTAVRYGVATATPCLSLPDTVAALDTLAIAVERRRLRGR